MREVLRRTAVILAVSAAWGFAAAPQIQWMKTFAGHGTSAGYCVQQTNDGGYIVAGETDTARAYLDFYLVKTDSVGDTEWEKTFSGAGSIIAHSVQQTTDGGYVVVGMGFLTPNHRQGVCLMKTDGFGNLEWQLAANDTNTLPDGYSVVQTDDGGYAIAAIYTMQDSGLLVIKTDSLGHHEWCRRYAVPYLEFYSEDIVQIRKTADGGYIVGTKTLLKVDSLGNQQWLRTYGGLRGAYSVLQTPDKGYIATGPASEDPNQGGHQIYLLRTDSLGNARWTRMYASSQFSRSDRVERTSDGGYVVAGAIQTPTYVSYILRTDSIGDVVWSDTLLDMYHAWCIRPTKDGGFIVAGRHYDAASDNDVMCLLKLAPEQ